MTACQDPMKEIHFQLHTHKLEAKDKEAATCGLTPPKPRRHWKTAETQGRKKYKQITAKFHFQNLKKT